MDENEIGFILQEGEGLKIEFKESFDSKSLAKEIVAFANSEGGRIFLGISDKGEIKGIEITNKLKSQIYDLARNCDSGIKTDVTSYRNILIVGVEEGSDKPYKCSSGFYLRQGPNSQKMSRDDIVDFISGEGKLKFDEIVTECRDYDSKLVVEYLKRAGIKEQITQSTLFNLGVADKDGFLNNAGILFFTEKPKRMIINDYITCARYKGVEKVHVIDRKDFEDDLVSQVEHAVEFVKRNTRLEYEIKGLYRKDIPEYPVEAVREAILNAVMHRDYFEKGVNVQIDIFDDRMSVTNIGSLIKPLTKEKLGTLAIRRNPLIADLFHRIHLVEKMGTGISRIREECRIHGNVGFEAETNGFFTAVFRLKKRRDEVTETTQKTTQKIIELIKENPNITRKELAEIIGISEDGIKFNLNKLKKKGLLKRIGPDKGGYWIVKEESV